MYKLTFKYHNTILFDANIQNTICHSIYYSKFLK